ncbi:bZIP-type transcription factor MBZ1 [Entomortierella parvispora]|uniref:BZIP-type transcription factor MBZ1 n=1 Tax=Entomortierella parvispora TaxID=205924 RepID=A0A9P3H819_9FUNG|nr:bZIP-type transcription factor MBZ1 [Entomortierella parvispora]
MANPIFDDFLELDLLDPSDASNDMFSYYLSGASDENVGDLGAAAAALAANEDAPEDQPMDLVIKQEEDDDSGHHTRALLLLSPASDNQDSATLKTESVDMNSFHNDTAMLVSPDQLTISPQATTVSPSTISLKATSSVSTSAASSTGAKTQATVSVDSSKPATTTAKRSSPEPTASARKHAKTESVSKSKANTSRKAAASSSSQSVTKSTGATKSKSTSSSSSSSLSSPSSSATASVEPPTPTTESLTSPVNTTLSAATLQFLLQQQMETPLIPQLFTGKLSREEIEETLARLLESTKHLIATDEPTKVKEENASDEESDDGMEGVEAGESEPTHGLKTQPGIKTDDIPSSTDLKKMTSKERRQLRNKISARNFRVRRKEYIYTLEGQVLQHKTEARHLREAVTLVQEENIRLRDELEVVRQQLAEATLNGNPVSQAVSATPDQASAAPLSKENQSLLSSIMSRNAKANVTLSVARPQSPILTPNLHKDIPNSSNGSTAQNSWKDKKPIMVHTTLVPEICFNDDFQFGHKASKSKEDAMLDRPWMKMANLAQDSLSNNPFWSSGIVFELVKTFTVSAYDQMVVDLTTDEDTAEKFAWEVQQNLWAMNPLERDNESKDEARLMEEQIELLCGVSHLSLGSSLPVSTTLPSAQEDPNMLDWLYESMMARLVELDLQDSQDHSLASSASAQLI